MPAGLVAWLLPCGALGLTAGILSGSVCASLWPGLLVFSAGLLAFFLLKGRARLTAVVLLFAAAGFLRAVPAWHPALPPEDSYAVTGVVTDEVRPGSNGQVRTVLTHVALNGKPFSAGAYWSFYPEEVPADLIPGKQVSLVASLYHPSGPANPGGYNFREDLLRRGVTVGLYGDGDLTISDPERFTLAGWTAGLRHRIRAGLENVMGEESGGYAATMLLGYRGLLSESDREAFSRLGIAHILAVSGFHAGVLFAVLEWLMGLFHASPRLKLLLTLPLMAFYCLLTGLNPPVVRACLLIVLRLLGRCLRRPRPGLHLLSAAYLLILLVNPTQLKGAGFQLSFCAVLGLMLVTPLIRGLFASRRGLPGKLADSFSAGVGAQLGCLLPQLYWFQDFPLLGLIFNVPVIFFSGGIILLYWLTLLFLPLPIVSGALGQVASALTQGMVSAVRWLSSLPGITLWTCQAGLLTALGWILLLLGLCSLLRLRGKHRLLLCAAGLMVTVLSLVPWPHQDTVYIQFSAGNADAALLWDRDEVIVVDTGDNGQDLAGYLRRHRLSVDRLILTHLHADHAGGVADLLKEGIPVASYCIPEGAFLNGVDPSVTDTLSELDRLSPVTVLKAGDRLQTPSGEISVLWPEEGRVRHSGEPNEWSLTLMIRLKGTSLLQTGDLDGRYEMRAAERADLLKVAHHGSAGSTSESFLQAVDPSVLLLSCKNEKRHQQVEERMPGVPLYSTALDGAITVRFLENGYQIEPWLTRDPGSTEEEAGT